MGEIPDWSSISRRQISFSKASPLGHLFIKLMNSDTMKSMEDLLLSIVLV